MSNKKLMEAILHIVQRFKDEPDKLGAVKLNKILWFSDVLEYQENLADGKRQSLTGERYIKKPHGPVVQGMIPATMGLEANGLLSVQRDSIGRSGRSLTVYRLRGKSVTDTVLTDSDKARLDQNVGWIRNERADDISEISHAWAWEMATEDEEIPLYATLAVKGAISSDDRDWAKNIIQTLAQ